MPFRGVGLVAALAENKLAAQMRMCRQDKAGVVSQMLHDFRKGSLPGRQS